MRKLLFLLLVITTLISCERKSGRKPRPIETMYKAVVISASDSATDEGYLHKVKKLDGVSNFVYLNYKYATNDTVLVTIKSNGIK